MGKKKEIWLIVICWISYVMAQLGRYSYSSNVTLIMDRFAVEHAEASLPATLFFFAYGIGQIVVGLICHKFNRKVLVVAPLFISAALNTVVFLGADFLTIKYIWLINGFVQANLWPCMLLIIRENVSPERIPMAGIVMSTASTGGKFLAMLTCVVFAIDTEVFMYCFLAAGVMLFISATLFLFSSGNIKAPLPAQLKKQEKTVPTKADKKSIVLLLLLGEFALACYAVSGGLQSWIPAIVKENYGMSDALSIFMSILLPLFTLSVAVLAPYLYKKLKNYVLLSVIAFISGGVLIAGVLFFIDKSWIPVIVLFTAEAISMGIVSNTTTVQVPLTFKGKFNAGFLAGYLNGTCYIGMALATYVLGYIADASGWTGAFILLISVSAFSALLGIIYLIFSRSRKTDEKAEEPYPEGDPVPAETVKTK